MQELDALMRPWLERLTADVGGLELLDAHTHIGANDPDGFTQTAAQLIEGLEAAGASGVVFPMHEPEGYRDANDAVLAAVAGSGGRLGAALCRVDPARDAVGEARRALDAGAAGIKLHPRAEGFTMAHPGVREVVAIAHERRLPVMIHAGRGIPALGRDTVRLATEFPGARLILAHAAISDLAWLWRELPAHPNVFVDTAWWNAVDVVALFALAPPGQVIWASDSPYGRPLPAAVQGLRCALQAGLTPDQVRAVAGEQMARLLDGAEPLDLGPAPRGSGAVHPLAERLSSHVVATIARLFGRADHSEPLALARLACDVGVDSPLAGICAAVLDLLDRFERTFGPPEPGSPVSPAMRYLIAAGFLARTPDVALPAS